MSTTANHTVVLAEENDPDRDTIDAIGQGLHAYNSAVAGSEAYTPLWIIGRDNAGTVQAGLRGWSFWSWLFVNWLWVAEAHRHRGLGSQLLLRAEAIARERGCIGVYLDTFSFQAPGFYLRHGYEEFGRLEGLPPNHARIWFRKRL
jgi:GNAT superfamily N-acetyltransferase